MFEWLFVTKLQMWYSRSPVPKLTLFEVILKLVSLKLLVLGFVVYSALYSLHIKYSPFNVERIRENLEQNHGFELSSDEVEGLETRVLEVCGIEG